LTVFACDLLIASCVINTTGFVGIPLAGILNDDGNVGNKGTRKGCPYNYKTKKEKPK